MKIWVVSLLSTELSPRRLTSKILQKVRDSGIRSLVKIPGKIQDILSSALPPEYLLPLALKLFRGEPAITKLD